MQRMPQDISHNDTTSATSDNAQRKNISMQRMRQIVQMQVSTQISRVEPFSQSLRVSNVFEAFRIAVKTRTTSLDSR